MYLSTVRGRRSLNSQNNQNNDNSDENENNCRTNCRENIVKYLESSSMHGLRYIGDKSLSNCERGGFIFAFAIVFVVSFYFITNVWEKWSLSPIIIGLNPVATQLKDIPFPAVTICNMNQANKTIAHSIEPNTLEHVLLQSVCLRNENYNATKVKGKWSVFQQFLLSIAQPCHQMIVSCKYASKSINCSNIFRSVLTDEGICCSFNSLAPKYMFNNYNSSSTFDNLDDENLSGYDEAVDWKPESGYPRDTIINSHTYPRPIAGTGSHMGLTVTLNAKIDDYYCSSTNAAGFKILLHSPVETPKIAEYGFSIEPGLETRVSIAPRISDATDLIRRVPKKVRQCIFANENNLTYFKTYSKKNCEMECESELTENECHCVMYFMPRSTEETNICSRSDGVCYEKIKLAIDMSDNETYSCGECLPGCSEINYLHSISTAQIGNGSYEIRNRRIAAMDPEYVRDNIALVHFFILESSFRSYTKGELIGFTEFLSNTGGLLGLFMGFSVISLIEIFYFMTLYPYCNRRRLATLRKSNKVVLLGVKAENVKEISRISRIKVYVVEKIMNNVKKIKNFNKVYKPGDDVYSVRSDTPPPQYPYCN